MTPDLQDHWHHKIAEFVNLILHGDEVHRAWLREAGEAFMRGAPIPPARDRREHTCAYCGKGAQELPSPHYLKRVNRLGDVPPVWICTEHQYRRRTADDGLAHLIASQGKEDT